MLPIPSNTDETVSIIGLDPGSENTGCCILTFNLMTFEILSIDAKTYTGSKLPSSPWVGEIFNDRIQRIRAHEENLVSVFNSVPNLVAIVSESPFINMRRPSAYGALTEVICAIRNAVFRHDCYKTLYMVDPPSAKKAVGAKGNGDKDAVKAALKLMPQLVNKMTSCVDHLDEHSIDSIAIAYFQYLLYKDSKMSHI